MFHYAKGMIYVSVIWIFISVTFADDFNLFVCDEGRNLCSQLSMVKNIFKKRFFQILKFVKFILPQTVIKPMLSFYDRVLKTKKTI